jgi:hypothetical protein
MVSGGGFGISGLGMKSFRVLGFRVKDAEFRK